MIVSTGQEMGVQLRRWTKEEYYRLGELGFFRGQKVELIEGELMVASPQNSLHSEAVDLVDHERIIVGVSFARCIRE